MPSKKEPSRCILLRLPPPSRRCRPRVAAALASLPPSRRCRPRVAAALASLPTLSDAEREALLHAPGLPSLQAMFGYLPDPRQRRGQRYDQACLLTCLVAALLCGCGVSLAHAHTSRRPIRSTGACYPVCPSSIWNGRYAPGLARRGHWRIPNRWRWTARRCVAQAPQSRPRRTCWRSVPTTHGKPSCRFQ
jgi:hypothetical protein